MNVQVFLIVNSRGGIRHSKNRPNLDADEIAILLDLDIPKAFFIRPTLQAKVSIDEKAAVPSVISPEILINTKELIEQQTGMRVEISAVPIKEPQAYPDKCQGPSCELFNQCDKSQPERCFPNEAKKQVPNLQREG